MKRMSEENGVTLVELLAALIISGIVMTIVVTIGLYTVEDINTYLAFNAAQRTVQAVSSGITSTLKTSDYVMVQCPAGSKLFTTSDFQLRLYQNGYLPTSASYNNGIYTGVGATGLQGNYTDNGYLDFQAQSQGNLGTPNTLWTVTYYDASGEPLNLGAVNIQMDYPSDVLNVQSGDFINSMILDLSETYKDGQGNAKEFHLTTGYHDKDLR